VFIAPAISRALIRPAGRRKQALRLLHRTFVVRPPRPRPRIYDESVRQAKTFGANLQYSAAVQLARQDIE
jgi:hypothetical protein